jgi:acetoin utilization deacetylase AcuC-like enzyme
LHPDAVVVSLGLDAAATDPESPLCVTEAGYFAAGRAGWPRSPPRS